MKKYGCQILTMLLTLSMVLQGTPVSYAIALDDSANISVDETVDASEVNNQGEAEPELEPAAAGTTVEGDSEILAADDPQEQVSVAESAAAEDSVTNADVEPVAGGVPETGDVTPTKAEYVYTDDDLKVTAVLDDPTALSDDAELCVTPVTKESTYYNYAAYLQALNNYAGAEKPAYTDLNTVLYDVAFLITNDELETVEVQPAQGAVTVTFEFLNGQLSNGIGVEDTAYVQVFHLPVIEDARAKTTSESTSISSEDVIVDPVQGSALNVVSTESLQVVTDSFSVFAVSYQPDDQDYANDSTVEEVDEPEAEADINTLSSTEAPARTRGTDSSIDANITDLLTEVKILEDGTEVPYTAEGKLDVVAGHEYEIRFSFQETDDHQFVIDSTTMYYDLPVNLTILEPMDGTFVMDFGSLGSLQNNTYHIENGKIAINWNTADPDGMEILNALGAAHFTFNIWGEFDTSVEHIEWSRELSTEVEVKEEHEATVSKSATYDKDNDEMDYVITVTSKGTTTGVVLKDIITGTVLQSKVRTIDDIVVKLNGTEIRLPSSSLTRDLEYKRFELRLPDMNNGDVYTIKYSASIQYERLHQSGSTTYDETNNSVELNWNENGDKPPQSDNTYGHVIDFSPLRKRAVKLDDEVEEDGRTYRYITWEIQANEGKKVHLGAIVDTIDEESRDIMSYVDGISIVVHLKDNRTEYRNLRWGDTSRGKLLLADDGSSWEYLPPDGEIAYYVITYKTKVDVTDLTSPTVVKNTTFDEYNHSGEGQPVGPTKDEVQLNKRVVRTTEDEIVWAIDIIVPKGGLDSAKVTDVLPVTQLGDHREYDVVNTIDVTGNLLEGESYKIDLAYKTYDPNVFPQQIEVLPYPEVPQDDSLVNYEAYVTFYQDEEQTTPGFKSSDSSRVITVTVTTKTNQKWLDRDAVNPEANGAHTNTAKIGNITAQGTAYPVKKAIQKSYVEKLDGDDGAHLLASMGFSDEPYAIYKYKVRISGARNDIVEIEDTFDTEVFRAFVGNEIDTGWYDDNHAWKWYEKDGQKANELYYGNDVNNDGTLANKVSDPSSMSRYRVKVTNTATGAIIGTTELPKTATGDYYSYYTIYYYLIMKDPAKAAEKAFAAGGEGTFTNLAGWEGGSSDAEIKYGNPIVDKKCTMSSDNTTATYTITINPDKFTLNNGNPMTLTDDFSKTLSVDYTSIRIATDPTATVSYDYYDNKGVFIIPDATSVTITYTARIVGTGSLELYNKVKLEGDYEDTTDDFIKKDASGTGGDVLFYIQVLKYKSENMQERPLAGAKFRLLDSEMNPIKYTNKVQYEESQALIGQDITFTTTTDVLTLMLSRARHGTNFKKDTVYYLEEIEAPPGMQLDPTLHSFVITDGDAHYQREDGVWVYYVGDILAIRNHPEKEQLTLYKRFSGNVELTAEQKAKLWFEVIQVDENGEPVSGGFKKTINYADLENNKYLITNDTEADAGSGPFVAGTYKVIEHNASAAELGLDDDVVALTTYRVDSNDEKRGTEIGSAVVASGKNTNAIFTNAYSTNAYYFTKYDPGTGEGEQPIEGAVFTVYDARTNNVITTHTTSSDGKFFISMRDEHSHYDTNRLYYVVETEAPQGYLLPSDPQRYYFYFAEEGSGVPEGLPEGATAVNLGVTSVHESVYNAPKSTLFVEKAWKECDGSNLSEDELQSLKATVHLKRKVSAYDAATRTYGSPVDDVTYDLPVELTYQNDFMKTWHDLELVDDTTGDKYTYYVTEDPVSNFTTTCINNEGIQEGTIEVVNTRTPGALKLTKLVTVDGALATAANQNIVDGIYEFEITNANGFTKTVEITVENGIASTAAIDGRDVDLDADHYVEISGLTPGTYSVAEVGKVAGTSLVGVTDGEGTSLDVTDGSVEVTVVPGDEVALDATIAFKNNTDTTEYYETTTYSGTKTWDGTDYESLHPTVYLYADGEKTSYVPTWDKPTGSNVWTYEFSELPVFAEDGHAISYTAQEEPLPQYQESITRQVPTSYVLTPPSVDDVTVKDTCEFTRFNIPASLDLSFVIIKTTDQKFIIWSQRQPTADEKAELTTIANRTFPDSAGKDAEFVWSTPYVYHDSHNRTASIAYKDKTITLEFSSHAVWARFAYGSFKATYDSGTTDFKNTQYGSLEITKNVTVGGQPATGTLADGTYSFEVKDDSGKLVDTVTITVTGGRSSTGTLEGLKPGTYTITETDSCGLVVDEKTKEVAVVGGAIAPVATVAFTNDLPLGSLKLKKSVDLNGFPSSDSRLNGTYEFTVTGTDADGGTIAKVVTITIENGEAVSATVAGASVELDEDGYVEVSGLVPGEYTITEDVAKNPTGVQLLGDNDKKVTVEAGKTGPDVTAKTEFVNNYYETEVVLKATKQLTGRDWFNDDSFEFVIEATGGHAADAPMPASSTIIADKDHTTPSFGAITFTEEGVWTYKVTEAAGTAGGITYSEQVFEVEVDVVEESQGTLVPTVKVNGTEVSPSGDPAAFQVGTFENTYKASGEAILSAKKASNTSLGNKTFSFQLIDDKGAVLQTSVAVKQGETVSFEAITYPDVASVGTYTYQIKEVIPAGATKNADGKWEFDGVVYDDHVSTVKVEVKDAGDGTLDVTYNGEQELITPEFVNTTVDNEKTSISVEKRWMDWLTQTAWPSGARVTVALMADGVQVAEYTLTASNASYTFAELPVYSAKGTKIVYTVEETQVSGVTRGFNTTITGDAAKGYVIKNTFGRLPKTGDLFNPTTLAVLVGFGVCAVIGGIVLKRRKKD